MSLVRDRALADSPMTLVDCGCLAYVYKDGSGIEIEYCPTHAAALDLLKVCEAAYHALKSYQYGNSNPDLAESVSAACDTVIQKVRKT